MFRNATMAIAAFAMLSGPIPCNAESGFSVDLSEDQLEELVQRSYQYVAMFNVNNKFALDTDNPMMTGGYNRVRANTALADHTLQAIARPNNDTLYAGALIDVSEEPIVLELPAFDSKYVSLMVTAYDHYVNIPMSSRVGDFQEPSSILFYSERTPRYDGAPVDGVDMIFETSGDFVSAVLRVMPHAAEPERMKANLNALRGIDVLPLREFVGKETIDLGFTPWSSPPVVSRNRNMKYDLARFPPFGSDFEIFEDRLLEVMQFVFNHTTFDPTDELDAALLAVYEPLGVVPGKDWDPATAANLDGAKVRSVAQQVARDALEQSLDPTFSAENSTKVFQPKGEMELNNLVVQSVLGPIGQPAIEAVYPYIGSEDGPLNAQYDYEIVMAAEDMPPANAFWSLTLYDSEQGFFIPNDRFKYSVGENAGYRLDENGGIRVVISAEKPDGLPEENWLPINRGDYDVDVTLRIYSPDLERFATWVPPVARKLQ